MALKTRLRVSGGSSAKWRSLIASTLCYYYFQIPLLSPLHFCVSPWVVVWNCLWDQQNEGQLCVPCHCTQSSSHKPQVQLGYYYYYYYYAITIIITIIVIVMGPLRNVGWNLDHKIFCSCPSRIFFPKKLSTKLFMEINSNGFIESSVPSVTLHITRVLPQRR